jgi:hypothetical protein
MVNFMDGKIWLLAAGLVISATVSPCRAEKWFAPDVNRELDATASNGAADANRDFVQGVYQQEVVGALSAEGAARARYLKDKYNVLTKPVGGTMVTSFETDHAKSYNATMQQLLAQRFGRDVFKEADQFTGAYAKGAKQAREDFARGVRALRKAADSDIGKTGAEDEARAEANNQLTGYNETMQKLLDDASGKKPGRMNPNSP